MKKGSIKTAGIAALSVLALASCGSTEQATTTTTAPAVTTTTTSAPVATTTTTSAPVATTTTTQKENPAIAYASYSNSDAAKQEILGKLEAYAIRNHLTGLTLYENGGYSMYNPRVTKGTNNYITGYGFGVLSEGNITADLSGETRAQYARYYHTYETDDPQTVNYMNDSGSVVSGLYGYMASTYFDTVMNEAKDGYDWVAGTSIKNRPIALNESDGKATQYRVYVKVGNAVKYNTNTANETLKKYNGRAVELEDYITPYKQLHNQSNALYRGGLELTSSSAIKGMADYYAETANGYSDEAWDKVGIKTGTDEQGSYIDFELNAACTPFYAMYYLSSSLYSPIPQAFLDDLETVVSGNATDAAKTGIQLFGCRTNSGLSPVDTSLSTGAYTLESWEYDKEIVYKKNPYYTFCYNAENRYKIQGIVESIVPAAKTDREALIQLFEAGKLDACGIPSTKLAQYVSDPRTVRTTGSSTFKLNLNTCTPEMWEYLFGENGTVTQTAKADYWEVEPAMQNENFVKALSFALNRNEFATNRGNTPSCNYFASSYMADPENGVAYNASDAHKNALVEGGTLVEGVTDDYGYSATLAERYFKQAAQELIASGAYKTGDTITVEVAWMDQTSIADMHTPLERYWEDAFNNANTGLTLDVVSWVGADWTDVYYKKMLVGQFDIGFGSISGNSYDPLNFMEVLKSDNSSSFTLNWGVDTSKNDGTLEYDGRTWSYDALWSAGDTEVYVDAKGEVLSFPAVEKAVKENTCVTYTTTFGTNADGAATITVTPTFAGENLTGELTAVYVGFDEDFDVYTGVKTLNADGSITVVLDAAKLATIEDNKLYLEIDYRVSYAFEYEGADGTNATGAKKYTGVIETDVDYNA